MNLYQPTSTHASSATATQPAASGNEVQTTHVMGRRTAAATMLDAPRSPNRLGDSNRSVFEQEMMNAWNSYS